MKVGIIGCGAMGLAMAGHIVKRGGGDVFAHDVDPERLKSAAGVGAEPVAALDELGPRANMLIVMVATDAQVRDVVTGVAPHCRPGTLVAVTSTVHPATMRELSEPVAAAGAKLIDAPVCFGLSGAREGRLASLCGGADADVAEARETLLAYSKAVHHVGPLGHGQLAKAVNNMLHWAHCVANYEALLLAKRFGIDPQALREVLLECPARNGTLADWDTTRFTWPEKDMDIVLDLAQEGGLTLPLYAQVDQLVKLLSPAAVHGLLYGESAPYLGRDITPIEPSKDATA